MRHLETARELCESYLPGLGKRLAEIPLLELEGPESPGIKLFREHGGAGLLVPTAYAGLGASALDAVRVVRAVASHSPSLAAATTMHHFSVATLFALAQSVEKNTGLEWMLLEGIARESLLVGSGFAEGRSNQGILSPTMSATATKGGFLINGSKKPCSLARSMDLLTTSVALPLANGGTEFGVMLIPIQSPGIIVYPFWNSIALAGAESDEVRLTNVFVQDDLVLRPELLGENELDDLQTTGFIWFELLISAVYAGAASILVERVFAGSRGSVSDRASLGVRLEAAVLQLEGVARMIMDGETDNEALACTLIARYAVQDSLAAAVDAAVELLGGMAFMSSSEVAYLAGASRALAFHPPSRISTAQALVDHFGGEPLRLS